MGKKKPFVDKKKSSTFHLLHRSQRDVATDVLLQDGDTAASDMVLWPSDSNLASTNQAVMTTPQTSSFMAQWRDKLEDAGLLQDDPERYLKPVTGAGTFLKANDHYDVRHAVDARNVQHEEPQANKANELLLEVDRQLDSIPLTAEFMDEEIAQALFGDFDEGDFEELNDEFVLDAAREPEDNGNDDKVFDYDEHIRRLVEKAQLERQGDAHVPDQHAWGHQDQAFFSQMTALREVDDDADSWDQEFGAESLSLAPTTTTAPRLTAEEERVLCERFEEALLEYDSDELGEGADEYVGGDRDLEGDDHVEAALDEFLTEKQDEIFIFGTNHNNGGKKRTGGSGFAALVGNKMIPASRLADGENNPADDGDGEPPSVTEVLVQAQERLALPPVRPPAEEILIDGKSYFSERERNPWDCESVLSTYSNLANNPVTIGGSRKKGKKKRGKSSPDDASTVGGEAVEHIQLSKKTGLPLGVLPTPVRRGDQDDTITSVNKGEARNKQESKQDKKARKEAVKRERLMARIQKKATREVFKEEFQKRAMDTEVDHMAGKSVFRYS